MVKGCGGLNEFCSILFSGVAQSAESLQVILSLTSIGFLMSMKRKN